ncbi:GumC family protein [Thermodesulfobacteriota bacterium]
MYEQQPAFEDEIHLRDYLRVILKARWMVATIFTVIVAFVTINSFTMEPVYRATTQILIEKENPKILNIEEVMGVDARQQDYYQTQYEVLKSKALALNVIRALHLKGSPEFTSSNGGINISLSAALGWARSLVHAMLPPRNEPVPNPSGEVDREYNAVIGAYLGRLSVDPIRNSRLVDVSFEGRNSEIITNIANAHARHYIQSHLERRFSASEDAVAWLNKKTKEVKQNLSNSEQELQAYRDREGLASIDFEDRQGIILQSLNALNAALIQAKTVRMEKENFFSELKRLSAKRQSLESFPAVVTNPLIQQLKARYSELSGDYSKLSEKFGPEHPNLVRLSSEMRELRKKIGQEISRIAESTESEYRVARAKENAIVKELEDKKKEALELNHKQIEYNVLKREVDTSRSLYESLLTRAKETRITEGLEATNIMVVDPARIPDWPIKPKKVRNILLACIVGLMLGIGSAFFVEYLDNTIKTPEEVEKYVRVPLLGVLGGFPQPARGTRQKELVVLDDPKSNIAEAFRTIRTNLLFAAPDVEKKTLLITSTFPLEGKTTVASNLAVSFVQMGKKVLLVDADLRKPRIHQVFDLERTAGLSDLLIGNESSFKDPEIEGLTVLTCGTIPPNPAEVLGSNSMRDFLDRVKQDFDLVLLDSPPLLSVTDASELAALSDGVVLVIKAASTPRPPIQNSLKQLADLGTSVFGCVLNAVDFEKERYYYSSYRYYYQYYYDSEDPKKKRAARKRRT